MPDFLTTPPGSLSASFEDEPEVARSTPVEHFAEEVDKMTADPGLGTPVE